MARPKKENKYIQAGFKLPKELLDALDAYVEKKHGKQIYCCP